MQGRPTPRDSGCAVWRRSLKQERRREGPPVALPSLRLRPLPRRPLSAHASDCGGLLSPRPASAPGGHAEERMSQRDTLVHLFAGGQVGGARGAEAAGGPTRGPTEAAPGPGGAWAGAAAQLVCRAAAEAHGPPASRRRLWPGDKMGAASASSPRAPGPHVAHVRGPPCFRPPLRGCCWRASQPSGKALLCLSAAPDLEVISSPGEFFFPLA